MAPLASAKAMAPLGVLVVHEVVHPARPGFCPREVELPRHFGEPDVADFLVRSPAVAGPTRDDIRHTVSALEVVDKGGADPDTYPDLCGTRWWRDYFTSFVLGGVVSVR